MYDMTLREQFSQHWAVICKESLGANSTGGRDFWITLRGRNDRLSNKFVPMGIVNSDGEPVVCEFMSPHLVDYLQELIAHAMKSWEAKDKYEFDQAYEFGEATGYIGPIGPTLDGGFLEHLPQDHARMFVECDGLATALGKKYVADRFFFAHSKKQLSELRKAKGDSTENDLDPVDLVDEVAGLFADK